MGQQKTFIPDDNFEQIFIMNGFDDVLDDSIVTANVSGMTHLNVQGQGIQDMTGVEGFVSLTHLFCSNNNFSTLNLSQNTNLVFLDCGVNDFLTSIDISAAHQLVSLKCYSNLMLTSLDVSHNQNLVELECPYNQISSLDLSQNPALVFLNCSGNNLTSIDVSDNIALNYLDCSTNQLTNLDVSQNVALEWLGCSDNQIIGLDLSHNIDLTHLFCGYNQIESLDLSHNNLFFLRVPHTNITELDVSQSAALNYLRCSFNQLTSLDVSQNTNLETLHCFNNNLSCLNTSNGNNINLQLKAYNNPILNCIEVDDASWSTANWTDIDPQTSFSEYCNNACSSETASNSAHDTQVKTLIKILDPMGRETTFKPNTPLIYVYDDGSTEKVFSVEY